MDPQKLRVGTLVVRLTEEEWAQRIAAGLPAHHVLSLDEFPLRYAKATLEELLVASADWRRAAPDEPLAALILGQALVIAGRYAEADGHMADYHRLSGDPMGGMRYAGPIPAPVRELPAVSGAWPRGPAFFVSCDERYWKLYGIPLSRSIARLAPGAGVHAHIMGKASTAAEDVTNLKLNFTTTFEDPGEFIAAAGFKPRNYYNAVRFVRFAEALEQGGGPLCILDADALAYRDPLSVFDLDADIALRARAGRLEAVHHFSACLVVARPGAQVYFRTVADIIRGAMHAPWWGLDQFALHSAFLRTKPAIRFLGPEWADIEASAEGVFWFTAGDAKTRLKTDDTPYARLFREYWTQAP